MRRDFLLSENEYVESHRLMLLNHASTLKSVPVLAYHQKLFDLPFFEVSDSPLFFSEVYLLCSVSQIPTCRSDGEPA
jgi:hypothetical protein